MARNKLPDELRAKLLLADNDALVPLSFAAKLFGVSETTIRNWQILEKYPDYEPVVYSLYEIFKYYCERKSQEIKTVRDKMSKLIGEVDDWNQNLKKEQTRTAELKNAQLELKLIEYAPLEQYLLNLIQIFASAIDDIPTRVSPKVVGCKNRQEAYLLLQEEMRTVKNYLADVCLDTYESKPIGIEMESPNGFKYDSESDSFVRDVRVE